MRSPLPRTRFILPFIVAIAFIGVCSQTVRTQSSTTVVVDTTSGAVDGDTTSVADLIADPGPDGKISFVEALTAVNNTGPYHTIKFDLPHGAVITQTHYLNAAYSTIDGDVDGDTLPDVAVLRNTDLGASLYIYSDHNIIKNIVMENIYIWGAQAHHNQVVNCYIGTDVDGKQGNAAVNKGVQVMDGAHHNTIENNIIAGNVNSPYNPDDIMSGIVLHSADDNVIRGNWIGVNVDGEPLPNDAGIYLDLGSQRNVIGGQRDTTACLYPCNVISGHYGSAIILDGSATVSNTIQGNYIGVSPDGATAMPNGSKIAFPTVYLRCGSSQNIIGGERDSVACDGSCNVISGNNGNGVELRATGSRGNLIQGNYIGVSPDGASGMRNGQYGVVLRDTPDRYCTLPGVTSNNLIGGDRASVECTGPCNVISGNDDGGILVYGRGSTNNTVHGNYIGVNPNGSTAMPTGYFGVAIYASASHNIVGGSRNSLDCAGPCNVISGQGSRGVGVMLRSGDTTTNTVQGNYVGLDATGTYTLPNRIGVQVLDGASRNVIGGDRPPGLCTGPCNRIIGNIEAGVSVIGNTATGNTIRGNEIRANGGLGIDLGADGITRNDPGDVDEGPNGLANFPVGVSAAYDADTDTTLVYGSVDTDNLTSVTIDVYADDELNPFGFAEGRLYLGATTPDSEGKFTLTVPGQLVYRFLTATSTTAAGSTSEFGARPPLIFVPAIAGSKLVDGYGGDELWIPPLYPVEVAMLRLLRLSLYPNHFPSEEIYAPDVLHWHVLQGPIYRPLLVMLSERGMYRAYNRKVDPDQPTTMICDFDNQKDDFPNLFVFPYDWRKSNIENAAKLEQYVDCVQQFHPGSQVDILTHSMGSLLTRRYILDNSNDHKVGKLITIGAPWLGAAKIIYVLQTGDFLDLHPDLPVLNDILKTVARSSPAVHELLPGRAYYDLLGGSPLIEEGWDLDDDKQEVEDYDYENYIQVLNDQYGSQAHNIMPGTTGDDFHQGGQDDWRADASGIHFYHLVGVQSGETAIARVGATSKLTCRFSPVPPFICIPTPALSIKRHFTQGDRTVPWFSAERPGYNAPDACLVLFYGPNSGGDDTVEHTALASNNYVHDTIFALLTLGLAPPRPAHGPSSCTPSSALGTTPTLLTPVQPYTYLTINGATSVVLSDTLGNSTAPISETFKGKVPGVDTYVLGDQIELLVMPKKNPYTVTFQTTSRPLAIELTTGTSDTATRAIRFQDLSLPLSVTAQLEISDHAGDVLRYDSDGDGSFETSVTATVVVSGPLANDLDPPMIQMQLIKAGEMVSVTLTATDSGSGVQGLFYSLDGTHYRPYTGTLRLDPEQTPLLYAFADDNVGNRRSRTFQLDVKTVYLPLVMR